MKIEPHPLGPFATNTYVLLDGDERRAWVVDPSLDSDGVAADLEERQVEVAAVINTHAHLDHAYGNGAFCRRFEAPLWAHEQDVPLLRELSTQAAMFGLTAVESPEPDRLLEEGDVLDLEGDTLRVLHTPGHSPGSITLVGTGFALVGDLIFQGSVGRTDLWQGDFETLRRSVREKVFCLPDDTRLLPGHGPETTVGREKRGNPFVGEGASI